MYSLCMYVKCMNTREFNFLQDKKKRSKMMNMNKSTDSLQSNYGILDVQHSTFARPILYMCLYNVCIRLLMPQNFIILFFIRVYLPIFRTIFIQIGECSHISYISHLVEIMECLNVYDTCFINTFQEEKRGIYIKYRMKEKKFFTYI